MSQKRLANCKNSSEGKIGNSKNRTKIEEKPQKYPLKNRVPAEQGPVQFDGVVGEGGEDEGAVRDALRAGQVDPLAHRAGEWNDREFV